MTHPKQEMQACQERFDVYADENLGGSDKKPNGDYLYESAADGREIWQAAYFARTPQVDEGTREALAEAIVLRLDEIARDYDSFEYGLPIHSEDRFQTMRQAALALLPTQDMAAKLVEVTAERDALKHDIERSVEAHTATVTENERLRDAIAKSLPHIKGEIRAQKEESKDKPHGPYVRASILLPEEILEAALKQKEPQR